MLRLKRDGIGHYVTHDGRFYIWQEPYHPRHWYVNDNHDSDATLYPEGFPSLQEARNFLEKRITKE